MSKKYDEYVETVGVNNEPTPFVPTIDKELNMELRDRAIIALVTKAIKEGKELSYGDIRLIIDNDSNEKDYENLKKLNFDNDKTL